MPDTRVQDEQGNVHVFPDGATPEMIAKALNVKLPSPNSNSSQTQAPAPEKPGFFKRLGQSFGLPTSQEEAEAQVPKSLGDAAKQGLAMSTGILPAAINYGRQVYQGFKTGNQEAREAVQNVSEGGPFAPNAGKFAGGALHAGLSAVPFIGPSISQAGEDIANKNYGGAAGGLTGVISQVAVPELTKRLGPGLQSAAETQFEKALAPTTKINKAIARDITPEMIKRGVRGSLEGMEEGAGKQISEINPQLTSQYQQLQGAGKVAGAGSKVIKDLEALKQSYMPEGNIAQPQAVSAIEGVQNVVKQYGNDISPNSLRRLRQIFEEAPAQRGAYAGADLSTNYTLHAQQAAADSIRGILNSNPGIGTLNKEISFWLDVQRVTRESGLRRVGQEGGLLRTMAPLGAGLAASTTGIRFGAEAGLEAGAATAALTGIAYQIMRSPMWRTTSAVFKSRVASSLARGDVGAATAALRALEAGSQESLSPPKQEAPKTLQVQPQGSQP